MTGYGTLKINASLASPAGTLEIRDRADEEALHKKIKLLMDCEKRIREERHRLEAELRTLNFKRYTDLSDKYELKEV